MKKLLKLFLFLVFLWMILFSSRELYKIYREYADSRESYDTIAHSYVAVQTQPGTEDTQPHQEEKPKEYAPIQVDFPSLIREGKDIIGWLYCEDTPINYPLVYHEDNDFYLRRLPNGTYSSGGSIFLDERNAKDFSDGNSILYGHNMRDDSMFGTLEKYRDQAYFDQHPVLYLLTPEQDYKIILLGGYTTFSTSDSYCVPSDGTQRDYLVQKALRDSTFDANTAPVPGLNLVTLSTCAYDYSDARYILVGMLSPLDRLDR